MTVILPIAAAALQTPGVFARRREGHRRRRVVSKRAPVFAEASRTLARAGVGTCTRN